MQKHRPRKKRYSKPLSQSSEPPLRIYNSSQGNTAFKAGDYPTAIGHYTTAFIADKSDFTFPLNRAAAYLKLNKSVRFSLRCFPFWPLWIDRFDDGCRNEDAERDCTTVLRMNPGNVKALFRRAQARIGNGKLGEAEQGLLLLLASRLRMILKMIFFRFKRRVTPRAQEHHSSAGTRKYQETSIFKGSSSIYLRRKRILS